MTAACKGLAVGLMLFSSAVPQAMGQVLNLTSGGTRIMSQGAGSGYFKADAAKIPARVSFDPGLGGPLVLSRDRAVALAREEAAKGGRTDLADRFIRVTFVEGVHIGSGDDVPSGACLWYYVVDFNYGIKGTLRYAVFLNEYVVKED